MSREETQSKTLRALGLCAKARRLIFGTPMVCEALKAQKDKIYLVLTPCDNSENTAKRLNDRCRYYGVRILPLKVNGEALARAVGKRAHVAALAITDENLCRLVESTLAENTLKES